MSDRPTPGVAVLPTKQEPGTTVRRLIATVMSERAAVVAPLLGLAVLVLLPYIYGNSYWLRQISLIAVLTMVVTGVNLSFGYAGEVQFGQVFMFALGSYLTMALAIHGHDNIGPLLIIGGLAAGLVGLIVALPALRIGGWSLAMASFFLVITIPDLVQIAGHFTGGGQGLFAIPAPKLFGHTLQNKGLYETSIIAGAIWMAAYRNLVTSRYGVTFRILRQSPTLAQSVGFSVFRLKSQAYALGSFPAGVAGCLFGYISLIISPGDFDLNLAIGAIAASVLGGTQSVYCAVIASALLQILPQESLGFANYAPVAYGLFLVFAAVLLRGGLSAKVALLRRWLLRGDPLPYGSKRSTRGVASEIADTREALPLGPNDGGSVLEVNEVSKSYGSVHAVKSVTLSAKPGQITALIGANGSGKTTLLNLVAGFSNADAGSITLGNRELGRMRAHEVARAGVSRTFQTPCIPTDTSVADVIASGRFQRDPCGMVASVLRLKRYWRTRRADKLEAQGVLDRFGLAHLADVEAASLPLGTRRIVEVARALIQQPHLLLLDEPASGLSEDEVHELGTVLKAATEYDVTVVLVEHNFSFVASVADVMHVLNTGEVIASGAPAEIATNPEVIKSYLGQGNSAATPVVINADPSLVEMPHPRSTPAELREANLVVQDLTSGYGDLQVLRGIDLTVPSGSIEVILGRNGVGKTTFLNAIVGIIGTWEGKLHLGERDITSIPSYRRAAAGIALVQEGKRIFVHRTVRENVELGAYALRLSKRELNEQTGALLARFPVLAKRSEERAGALSGGQQQMLAIAQALASRPKVLLLDEPSAGLAPTIVDEVFAQLRLLADGGLSVVLVEQLADRAIKIADHVTVLDAGKVTASGEPADFEHINQLQEAYFGGADNR